MEKPVISFKSYEIEEYIYKKITDVENNGNDNGNDKDNFEIEVTTGITEDLKSGRVNIQIKYYLEPHDISLTVNGFFELDEKLSKDELEKFLVINGTAIVFPYIRSIISMLSSLDSENAIILPTINTSNLFSK